MVVKWLASSKISYFHYTSRCHQHIATLQIPVHNPAGQITAVEDEDTLPTRSPLLANNSKVLQLRLQDSYA